MNTFNNNTKVKFTTTSEQYKQKAIEKNIAKVIYNSKWNNPFLFRALAKSLANSQF